MNTDITLAALKGIHPGFFLERELAKRKLSKGRFAISIEEFPQTIGAITKGKRGISISLGLRLDKALGFEEGFFSMLQLFYDIKEEKQKNETQDKPDLTLFRPGLFWDTDIHSIDWQHQKRAVIARVFERGNEKEQQALIAFYGWDTVNKFRNIEEHIQ